MPAPNVEWPPPLQRLNPWYPGQFGVGGAWTDTGERMHCTGTVFYVDPNMPGVHDGRDGTDPTEPLATVATALTKVQPQRGDVIVVMSNDYWYYAPGGEGVSTDYITPITEEITIPYTASSVRIVGLSNGTLGAMWQPASNGGTCITVHAIDVTIEGFVFTEGDYSGCDAIYAEWDGVTLFGENLTVRNCVFDDTVDTAIQLEYSWYCDIHHNWFLTCDEYGIYVDAAGSGIAWCEIHHNWFHDCTTSALWLRGAANCKIHHNNIYSLAAQGGGAATDMGITTEGGLGNIVEQNTLSCLLPAAAPGDYDDFCTPDIPTPPGGATDAWVNNLCMNGPTVTNPA